MMLQKIKNKIKKYFAPAFDPKNKERGLIPLLIVGGGAIATAIGTYFFGGSIGEFLGKELIVAAAKLLMYISASLLQMSGALFSLFSSSPYLQQSITSGDGATAQTVIHGWAIVRDFANMFIVLGFVVIGIATILRIREYEAQKKLLPLIIVALLINFSLLICGIVIDASNITMRYFTQISGPTTVIDSMTRATMDPNLVKQLKELADLGQWETYVSLSLSYSVYNGTAAMIFFVYAVLLIFRYVALMLLAILSPLAFVCSVFPATKSVYEKWKSQFIQWAIIGIPTAFFVYLAGHIAIVYRLGTTNAQTDLSFWIPAAFLLFAYSLIFSTSAIGASAALGLATGAMGYVAGRVKGGAKWTGGKALDAGKATGKAVGGMGARATGIEALTQRMGSGWGNVKEKLRLSPTGTQAAKDAERTSKEGKNFELAYAKDPAAKSRIQDWAKSEKGARGAAAMETVAKANDLNSVFGGDLVKMNERVEHAERFGSNRKIFTDKDPRLEGLNRPKINDLMKPKAKGGKGMTEAAAKKMLIQEKVKNLGHQELRKLDSAVLTPEIVTAMTGNQVRQAYQRGTPAQIVAIKSNRGAIIRQARAAGKGTPERKRLRDLAVEITKLP